MYIRKITGVLAFVAATAFATLGLAPIAAAHEGPYAVFNDCPTEVTEAEFCLHSETVGGEVVLGSKTTPIVHPVTLQGGYTEENAEGESKFFPAVKGETLSKTPQPVPGGLLGLVNPEDFEPPVREVLELVLQNGYTGVNATLELALPANEITLNSNDLLGEHGVALHLPVKIHLENPFLGESCYVGSATQPIDWELTTGETSPPAPNKPIHGTSGEANTLEGGRIATLTGTKLVENAWAAPKVEGCGGALAAVVNPVVALSLGETTAGHNAAILDNDIELATTTAVRNH